jgi:transketolase
VETTTGPLGQGITNAVGMALAEKLLAQKFNRPGHTVVDHRTYAFMGDGCLMEGISHEACALAGAWKLNKLIALYDDNGISIDGKVAPWFVDDVAERFDGLPVERDRPGRRPRRDAVDRAIAEAKQAPTPHADHLQDQHRQGLAQPRRHRQGARRAAGRRARSLTRAALGWAHEPFVIPETAYAAWDAKAAGARPKQRWDEPLPPTSAGVPRPGRRVQAPHGGELPPALRRSPSTRPWPHTKAETVASRKASQIALEAFTAALPELLGGSADLTGSNLTNTSHTPNDCVAATTRSGRAAPTAWQGRRATAGAGRHINYGVREFGMAAIMNGMALHGGYIPYGGTFLTFSDYSRNAIRMAALMKQRVIHVFTHDSIGLGEDGPTHQSVEHAASLRLIPGLDVWRPADTAETAIAWAVALENRTAPARCC